MSNACGTESNSLIEVAGTVYILLFCQDSFLFFFFGRTCMSGPWYAHRISFFFFFCLRLLFSILLFPSFFPATSLPFFFLRLLDIHCYFKRRSDLRFLTCTSRSLLSRLCLIRLLYSSRCVFYNFFFFA